nr:phosphate transporter [Hymenolepis microstoma]
MLEERELLLVVVGFMIAFISAFGLGANDVANSFGTSVGSKVLSLRAACILATICEISGSVLLGGDVSATVRDGIIDPTRFNESENGPWMLMQGQVSSLVGSTLWMMTATFFKMPVSATHSIVGATAGFGLVLFGLKGINWKGILKIVASWFISPVLSGLVSSCLYCVIKYTVLNKAEPLEPALNTLPFLYGITITVNVFSVLYGGLEILTVPKIELWIVLVTSFGSGIGTALIVFFFVRPHIRKKVKRRLEIIATGDLSALEKKSKLSILKELRTRIISFFCRHRNHPITVVESDDEKTEHGGDVANIDLELQSSPPAVVNGDNIAPEGETVIVSYLPDTDPDCQVCERPEETQVFAFAQILTATFGSFVHGGNDVSNAIGPVIGLWIVATTGNVLMTGTPAVWILFYGGVGISVGLWTWGRKVMQTIGTDLTEITPTAGVCIELGAAVTVLIASKVGLPISTTHCLVGSVIFVGYLGKKKSVNWKLFTGIAFAWIITLPVSCGLSALTMYIFTLSY